MQRLGISQRGLASLREARTLTRRLGLSQRSWASNREARSLCDAFSTKLRDLLHCLHIRRRRFPINSNPTQLQSPTGGHLLLDPVQVHIMVLPRGQGDEIQHNMKGSPASRLVLVPNPTTSKAKRGSMPQRTRIATTSRGSRSSTTLFEDKYFCDRYNAVNCLNLW